MFMMRLTSNNWSAGATDENNHPALRGLLMRPPDRLLRERILFLLQDKQDYRLIDFVTDTCR